MIEAVRPSRFAFAQAFVVPLIVGLCSRLVLLAAAVALFAGPAAAERRVALVVGVSAYVAVPHLPNTRADATDIAAALKRLGFEVDLVADPVRPTLESAVRRLGERATGADAAMFF